MSNIQLENIAKDFGIYAGINIFRYLMLAGTAYVIFWVIAKEKFKRQKIKSRLVVKEGAKSLVSLEIRYSLMTMLVVALIFTAIDVLSRHHLNRIYYNISEHGWVYFILSIPLMLIVHDAYFYFLHRTLHHPKIFKLAHSVHHLSTSPTPFAAYSFHPIEAVLSSSILFVVTFIMPVHFWALVIFSLIWTFCNINGHLGYEFFPKKRWFNNSTAHHMHHQWINGNYGLYFTFWDRWLNTWKD